MWSDNEADVDLLGFDFLVDELMVALTNPRLLPLTVGLLGDWGSGKTSALKIVGAQLEAESPPGERYVVVRFSPWQFEGYDDVKFALMDSVLTQLQAAVASDPVQTADVGALRRAAKRLRRPAVFASKAGLAGLPAATALALAHDPSMVPVAQAVVGQAAGAASAALDHAERPSSKTVDTATANEEGMVDVATFRSRYESLVDSLTDVMAVVVLVDDLDRCLPRTIVDTFEGIRLFLHTSKAAYVIAAHPSVVQSAIDQFYPDPGRPGSPGLGAEYLEKMLQVKVDIPMLSAPEAETYMQLLLAHLHLPADVFDELLSEVRRRRAQSPLAVALNPGIAAEVLGRERIPAALFADMGWVVSVAPLLGATLRGNPRQLKRFMNSVLMRMRSAERRGTTLDPAVLAKLMVLEEQYLSDFQQLFDWQQQNQAGALPELAAAERRVRAAAAPALSGTDTVARAEESSAGTGRHSGPPARGRGASSTPDPVLDPQISAWAETRHVAEWLLLEPALGTVDLAPYFTYARAKLTVNRSAARLPATLQDLLARLLSDVDGIRRAAVGSIATEIAEPERALLMEHLFNRALVEPDGVALQAVLEIAEKAPDTVPSVCRTLKLIPLDRFPEMLVAAVVRRLPGTHPDVVSLLGDWEAGGHQIGAIAAQLRQSSRR